MKPRNGELVQVLSAFAGDMRHDIGLGKMADQGV